MCRHCMREREGERERVRTVSKWLGQNGGQKNKDEKEVVDSNVNDNGDMIREI